MCFSIDNDSCTTGTVEEMMLISSKSLNYILNIREDNIVFFCVCPRGSLVQYFPRNKPMQWDLYHKDQIVFVLDVINNAKLQEGGCFYSFFGDDADLPPSVMETLFTLGQPLLSHAFRKHQKHPNIHAILVPDFHFIRSRGYKDIISKFSIRFFEPKIPKVFWRGTPTGPNYGEIVNQRSQMCVLAKHTFWVDAGITKVFSDAAEKAYEADGILKEFTPELEWANYQGIIDVDGSVNAWGLFWRLASGSVVFKFESNWSNPYIESMIPWLHYIPLKADLSDFVEITRLINSTSMQGLFQRIALNAKELTERFSYEAEVTRVATDLTQYWRRIRLGTNLSEGRM